MTEGSTAEKKVWSQTGIVTGSSTFVLAIVDMWFQSSMIGGGVYPSFRQVVDKYTIPGNLRPNPGATPSTKSRGGSSLPKSSEDDDETSHEAWHARDMEHIEWRVMMTELLVWAWIEARGVQRQDIEGTGVGKVLYRDELGEEDGPSGWLAMARTLSKVGGTLEARWEDLESEIEDAIDENGSR
ncbi:hypothetical protein BG000_004764 [Podila horticola]|nr:hypothetical protein BG000_004764 [Podila horticola]